MAAPGLQREREYKLIMATEVTLPELDGVGGLQVTKLESRDLTAIYWDTPDLALARWGSTLRFRSDQGWCAKLSAGSDDASLARDEVVMPGDDSVVPSEMAGLLAAFSRGRVVSPAVELAASRDVLEVADSGGEVVAIITDDRVTATGDAVETPHFREVEIELAGEADEEVVAPLVTALAHAGADGSDPRPKLLRALDLPAHPAPEVVVPPVSEQPTAREVIHAGIASATRQLIEHLPGAWLGQDPEGVHQSRVAMRRLRSDLGTFGPLVGRRFASDLRSELSWLGSVLGAVRDVDVLIISVSDAGLISSDIDEVSHRVLVDALIEYRAECNRDMQEAIASSRAAALLDALVTASADPPLAPQADDPASVVMRPLVRRRLVRMRRAAGRISDDSPDSDLHALRIQAKRVRYAAEAVEPVFGRGARRLAKGAAKLQSSLGELNDAAVATALLGKVAGSGGPAAFAAGQISGLLIARGQRDRECWGRQWESLDRRRNTGWLDE